MSSTFEPRNVIFDLDGTLVDSLPGIASSIQYAVRDYPANISPAELRTLVGPPVRQILRRLLEPIPEPQLNRVEEEFRTAYDSWGWKQTEAFPSVLSTLGTLHEEGLRLFLFTNKPQYSASKICDELGLTRFFSAMLSKDSREPGYISKAEMLQALVADFALEIEDCLVVGDSQDDYLSAAQLKMEFVHASYGYGRLTIADSPVNAGSIDSIDSFDALLELCRRQNFA